MTAITVTAVAVASTGLPRGEQGGQRSVLFIGDSFTAGATIDEAQAYPALIAHREGWRLHVDAQGGTGFIADGQGTGNGDTSKLIDRIAQDGRMFPDVDLVVLDAGRNDLSFPANEVAEAMSQCLMAVRHQWPDAKIATVVPSFLSPDSYDGYQTLVRRLATASAAVGGVVIDPVAQRWYDSVDSTAMVSADGVHPNADGSTYIGERLLTSLRDHGLAGAS
ncbi:SGNH/GDSL hydrolase family protein [Mycobacterium sp. NPDC051804]|uniref:SGNH/GDSL hydrolase family protein n=1 Tax=Mycobacterium sp. NPDC051804 TaxID=3364295 RepID=UPI0037AF197F